MSIIDNKKAFFDYFIEDRYEAGLVLQGWEIKAIREGRVQIKEAYVVVRNGELFLFGAHISALSALARPATPANWTAAKLAARPAVTPQASLKALPNSSGATRPETSAKAIIWIKASIEDASPRLSGNRLRAPTWIAGMATAR